MSAVKRARSRIMETLANLALRKPLHALEEMCETQNQVSIARLEKLIVLAGGELADYAHTLRQDYDALAAECERLHPIQQCLRENGQQIAERAFDAQEAKYGVQQAEQVPVAWQFFQDGKWWNGSETSKTHRRNTEEAGYPVRDLFAAQPATPAQDVAGLVEALSRIAAGEKIVERDGHSMVENDAAIDYPGIAIAALAAYKDAPAQQPAAVDGMSTAARDVLAEWIQDLRASL